jgi:DNA-binding MarR family transcriptional regulator
MVTWTGSEVSRLVTQVTRYVVAGLMEDVFAETTVEGPAGEREGITAAQFEVLRYIDRHERPTVKELATGLGISSAAATKAVNGLADDRAMPLVRRARGSDRRTVRLATTAAGHELVRLVRERFTAQLDEVAQRMSEADREALVLGLRGFLQAAIQDLADCDAACLRCGIDHRENCVVQLAEMALTGAASTRC